MTRVLVTGATGFIGRAVCRALGAAGCAVVAAVRDKGADIAPGVATRVVPDIGPATDWAPHLEGVDAIVHLAARVHRPGETDAAARAESRRVNRDGTLRLAEAASAAGVRRVVFASSVKVNGETTSTRSPFNEGDPPQPHDSYAVSKWEAEQGLRAVAVHTGLEAVIVRPPLVYGEGVKANFLTLLKICRRAPPLPFAAVDNRRSLIYVGNLADAVARCVTHPAAAGQVFLVRDGEDVSTPELVRRIATALGRPARLFAMPPALLKTLAGLVGRGDMAARLLDTLAVDDRKIRRELGWSPPFTMAEGLARTASWFLSGRETQGNRERSERPWH
jgi:nucleoside-diphosphate-sugar epimerase